MGIWPKVGTANHARSVRRPDLASIHEAAKDERRIGATEAEGIRQNHVDGAPFRAMRQEINRRLHGRIVEIDGWWRHTVAHGKDREDRLDGARGAEQVPDRGLS